MFSEIEPYIRSQNPVPIDTIRKLILWLEEFGSWDARRNAANDILDGADWLLSPFYWLNLISGDLTLEAAQINMNERKSIFLRYCELLPGVLRLSNVNDDDTLRSVLYRLVECCEGFKRVATSPHEKVVRKNVVRRISLLNERVANLLESLKTDSDFVSLEFNEQLSAEWQRTEWRAPIDDVADLHLALGALKFATDVILFRDIQGDIHPLVSHNMSHTYVIEAAYEISSLLGSPKFVTTPGSDFATLCSLIYELATGAAEESMAGAISKFSRSAKRHEFDSEEDQWRADQKNEEDNFVKVMEEIRERSRILNEWQDLKRSRDWSEEAQTHLDRRIKYQIGKLTEATQRHGPFRVWMNQLPKQENDSAESQIDTTEDMLLESAILLGKLRRLTPGH